MNPLIFIPSPRANQEFYTEIDKLPYDKFWIKYLYTRYDPYGYGRLFFLNHKEYTHFIICPDDLFITQEGVKKLIEESKDYPVIMGICNTEIHDHPNGEMAITKNLPDGDSRTRKYEFYTREELKKLSKNGDIIEAKWCGTPFAIFRRDIFEKIDISLGDRLWYPDKMPFSNDLAIAHQLHRIGVRLMVDLSVYFYHHRKCLKKDLLIDVEEPYTLFEGKEFNKLEPITIPKEESVFYITDKFYNKSNCRFGIHR